MVESYKQLRSNPSKTTSSSHKSYNNSAPLPVALKTPSHPASLRPVFLAVSPGSSREHPVVPHPCAEPTLGAPGEAHVTMGLTIFSRHPSTGFPPTIGPTYEPSLQKVWTDSVFHVTLKPPRSSPRLHVSLIGLLVDINRTIAFPLLSAIAVPTSAYVAFAALPLVYQIHIT
jgi:hypothetical protein